MEKTPTPFGQVNAVLMLFTAGVQAVLPDHLVGLYLAGSLACGDYDPERSDIDFVCATRSVLPEGCLSALEEMHARITACGLQTARELEGMYIPLGALRRYDPALARYPALNVDGHFGSDGQGIDGILQRHILREHGIALVGPDPHTLVDPVSPGELKMATRQTLRDWWAPQLKDSFRLEEREYQAYAALTMCRALYTIQYGVIVSKPFAARWAMQELEPRWRPLIERALTWREGDGVKDVQETLEMVRWTLEKCVI